MRVAHFQLSVQFLETLLNLPHDARVIGVESTSKSEILRIWIESPDFPESGTLYQAPECRPSFKEYCQRAAMMEDWNLRA